MARYLPLCAASRAAASSPDAVRASSNPAAQSLFDQPLNQLVVFRDQDYRQIFQGTYPLAAVPQHRSEGKCRNCKTFLKSKQMRRQIARLSFLNPNAANPILRSLTGSRSPFWAASMMRLAITS
jgi:hypothetical protein